MHLLCLIGRSRLARTDGPYRFVCDDQFRELLGRQVVDHFFDLGTYDVEVFAGLAVLELLAHAVDRCEVVLVSLSHFLVQRLARLAVVFAALAVAEDHIFDAQRGDHLGRYLSGIGALGFGCAVLGRHGDARSSGGLDDLRKVGERRSHDEVHA